MTTALHVWRDGYDSFEHVGILHSTQEGTRFSYDADYNGPPISACLPLQKAPFSIQQTAVFFSALSPEGPAREDFLRMLRASSDEYLPLLDALNDESIGGLVFSPEEATPGNHAEYKPIPDDFFDALANSPRKTTFETLGRTRLSLSGAMSKVGLYFNSQRNSWFLPIGSAPSTHIVKAGSSTYEFEVINEALCLGVATRCGFDVPDSRIITTNDGKLLLAVERFDRSFPNNPKSICGLPVPLRLHQEDFCQLCSVPPSMKYEPTDGHYLSLVTSRASRLCANGFGESQLALSYVLFDYLIGNCDNHLKNFALLYDASWLVRQVAPLYDVVNTTLYPALYTEMGVSFGGNRSIFGLTRQNIEQAIADAHLPMRLGMAEFDELAETIPLAVEETASELASNGYEHIDQITELMLDGIEKRRSFNFNAANVKTL